MELIRDREDFGKLIIQSDVSLKVLAKELRMTHAGILGYKHGNSFPLNVEKLETLCRLCEIDINQLDLNSLVHKKYKRNFIKYLGNGNNSNDHSNITNLMEESNLSQTNGGLENDQEEPIVIKILHYELNLSGYKITDIKNNIIIGKSLVMQNVFKTLEKITSNPDQESVVLITGETGTGKELIARAIHYNSLRRESPYVGINIASSQDTLIESELFGHRRGAFTGAIIDKKGFLEVVSNGTILLDEIGSLNKESQVKLLRVIQEREFYKVGSTRVIEFKGRIVVATKEDLEELVKLGKFREDLFYRINVISLNLPPLRERGEDILNLFSYFVNIHNNKYSTNFNIQPTDEGLELLSKYHFPGNIRELENLIKKAIFDSEDGYVKIENNLSGYKNIIIDSNNLKKIDFIETVKKESPNYGPMTVIEKNKFQVILEMYYDTKGDVTLTTKNLGYKGTARISYYFKGVLGIKQARVRQLYEQTIYNQE